MEQLHQRKRSKASKSDNYGTPNWLYEYVCRLFNVYPSLDICATIKNRKCDIFFTKKYNSLKNPWNVLGKNGEYRDIWCNPPHTMTEEFVKKAYEEWNLWSKEFNIIMIIPANSMCTKYAEKYIQGSAEYHPIFTRPTFLVGGKDSKFNARNGYFAIYWKKKGKK